MELELIVRALVECEQIVSAYDRQTEQLAVANAAATFWEKRYHALRRGMAHAGADGDGDVPEHPMPVDYNDPGKR